MIWVQGISIHAPLAGCDQRGQGGRIGGGDFNPRTPCGVRPVVSIQSRCISDFNPRTPCGVRLASSSVTACMVRISIHAPLAGCDRCRGLGDQQQVAFQSTHPLRGATYQADRDSRQGKDFNPRTPCGVRPAYLFGLRAERQISIHAPLAGCDSIFVIVSRSTTHFNPRTPCGVRHGVFDCDFRHVSAFQSTHPLRGATISRAETAHR